MCAGFRPSRRGPIVSAKETVEKGRQRRSRPSGSLTWRSSRRSRSKPSTYSIVRLRFSLPAALLDEAF